MGQHGGARQGAGRPKTGRAEHVSIYLHPTLAAALRMYADEAGMTVSSAVADLLGEALDVPKPDPKPVADEVT